MTPEERKRLLDEKRREIREASALREVEREVERLADPGREERERAEVERRHARELAVQWDLCPDCAAAMARKVSEGVDRMGWSAA